MEVSRHNCIDTIFAQALTRGVWELKLTYWCGGGVIKVGLSIFLFDPSFQKFLIPGCIWITKTFFFLNENRDLKLIKKDHFFNSYIYFVMATCFFFKDYRHFFWKILKHPKKQDHWWHFSVLRHFFLFLIKNHHSK